MKAAIALLLAISLADAAFLVGEAKAGGEIPILCENEESVYISTPTGGTFRLGLDSDFQAVFVPQKEGPHTVQCGSETMTVEVGEAGGVKAAAGNPALSQDYLVLAALLLMLFFFAAAAAIVAKVFFLDRTVFEKEVEGNSARLFIRAGKRLENIRIEDPVAMHFSKKPLRFSLPLLVPGAEWSYEYAIESPERALPASLEADLGGSRVALLSGLLVMDDKKHRTEGKRGASGRTMHSVPKAP